MLPTSIKALRGSKTAERLAKNVRDELLPVQKLMNAEKTLTITRDNGSDATEACELPKRDHDTKQSPTGEVGVIDQEESQLESTFVDQDTTSDPSMLVGGDDDGGCLSDHAVNELANAGLSIEIAIKRVRQVCTHFRRSNKATAEFMKSQQPGAGANDAHSEALKLPIDVPTRSFDEQVKNFKNVNFSADTGTDRSAHKVPSTTEADDRRVVFCETCCTQRRSTVVDGSNFEVESCIRWHRCRQKRCSKTCTVLSKGHASMERSWKIRIGKPEVLIAARLDPRRHKLKFAPGEEARKAIHLKLIEQVEEVLKAERVEAKQREESLQRQKSIDVAEEESGCASSSKASELELALATCKSDSVSEDDCSISNFNDEDNEGALAKARVEFESCEKTMARTEACGVTNLDVFDWWRKHHKNFPSLAVVARHHLSTPATSVESERIFSLCGFVQAWC
eukprot:jgi/Bigna1/137585/aug1.40_g12293